MSVNSAVGERGGVPAASRAAAGLAHIDPPAGGQGKESAASANELCTHLAAAVEVERERVLDGSCASGSILLERAAASHSERIKV